MQVRRESRPLIPRARVCSLSSAIYSASNSSLAVDILISVKISIFCKILFVLQSI